MSQRIYLVPFEQNSVSMLTNAIKSGNTNDFINSISDKYILHSKIVDYSCKCEEPAKKALSKKLITENEFNYYTALRPFFITCDSSLINFRLKQLNEKNRSIRSFFNEELKKIKSKKYFWGNENINISYLENIFSEIAYLNDTYSKICDNKTLTIQNAKLIEEIDTGISYYSDTETEEKVLKGADLIEYFAIRLGTDLGRILGKLQPNWWLGRDFWLGKIIMIAPECDSQDIKDFADVISKYVFSSGKLFDHLKIDNLEKALPINCEPYTTGMVIPNENIPTMLNLLQANKDFIIGIFSILNEAEETDISVCYNSMIEAFNYANEFGLSLIEGDDIVGSYGMR